MNIRCAIFSLAIAAPLVPLFGQTPLSQRTPAAASAPTAIPSLVPYSGIAIAADGRPLAGETSVTFLIFKEEAGGEPLWAETQSAAVDVTGHYKVQLGAANPNGLPTSLFATGEARWLEVQIAGEASQPRVLLASVPYALKAADAATLGGLPASAFVLAGTINSAGSIVPRAAAISPEALTTVSTAGGAAGYIPVFNGASSIVDSVVIANSTGIGILDTPASGEALDVNGKSIFRNSPTINRNGNASVSAGVNSYPLVFEAETYNSSTKAYTYPEFSMQAEAAGNDSSTPTAALHFLFNSNLGYGAETGLYFNANGTVHFASGQTFDGVASTAVGVTGSSNTGTGVDGISTSGIGVVGQSATGNGLRGTSNSTSGILGVTYSTSPFDAAVYAVSYSEAAGVIASSSSGEGGTFSGGASEGNGIVALVAQGGASTGGTSSEFVAGGDGIEASGGEGSGPYADGGTGGNFSGGFATDSGFSAGYGIYSGGGLADAPALGNDGIYAVNGYSFQDDGGISYAEAGTFVGNVNVEGTLTADVKDFRIDHPADPANKYLTHTSVESSEMMNIYTGNVTTDQLGLATVTLPGWFQTLNADFRYQLTVIGGRFAQAIVSKEIEKNQFTISTNASGVKVSWQVTAIRQDAYAKAHPLVVEQMKPANERGFYTHPELYGQPEEKQTEWGRNPRMARHAQAVRNAQIKALKAARLARAQPQVASGNR